MTFGWEFWFGAIALAVVIGAAMAYGVLRLRRNYHARWKGAYFCVVSVLLTTGISGFLFYLSHETDIFVRSLKNPSPPAHLSPDWGAQLSAEERFKNSRMLASTTFVNWGIHVNYFDENGTFMLYRPTEEDRVNRALQLRYIDRTALTSTLLFWAAVGWILVPWLGLAVGFMPSSRQLTGALTSRSNTDAPPAGGAPLS